MQVPKVILPLMFFLSSCSGPICENQTIKSLKSADGDHEAVLFARACGDPHIFTTEVSVDPLFRQFLEGNVFAASGVLITGPDVEIAWTSADELLISYDEHARIVSRHDSRHNVRIVYRPTAHVR